MNLMCRLLKIDPDSREGAITRTSFIGIVVNMLIAAVKVTVGALTSSIAIISEGVNNATDSLSSIVTIAGTVLAGKHPDEKHPFGYGRIEYLAGLVIAVIILLSGFETLKSSVGLIFHPEELSVSYISLAIIGISAVVKFILGNYTIKKGKETGSSALEGVGVECRNDSYVSVVTIVSSLLFFTLRFSIDAYVGVFMSVLILKAGIETLLATVSELIGRPGEEELAATLYREIRSTPGILNAADMMLHNYGPNSYSGSVNVEIDHEKNVGDVYQFLHELQLRIMMQYHVTMVFGIYAVDNDHIESREIRKALADFVKAHGNIKSFHAVYIEPKTNKLYCDFVVDYKLQDWDSLREEFSEYMKDIRKSDDIILTIETEFV